ncbi:hypothetical protein ABZT06_41945 [Streptomyces sp. NPDC005483]|uniref:hypothetical protein n=1 Tax=Streptomyces sp. NPDC005483 TaxID=3154882 RepID=UPI0033B6F8C5
MLGGICVRLAVFCGSLPRHPGRSTQRGPRSAPCLFQRLFTPGTVGFDCARRCFTDLFAVPATGLRLDLERKDDQRFLVLRGHEAGGGALCDAWPVQDSAGRGVLSAVPLASDPCDRASAATR